MDKLANCKVGSQESCRKERAAWEGYLAGAGYDPKEERAAASLDREVKKCCAFHHDGQCEFAETKEA